jgi:hypothetical protein
MLSHVALLHHYRDKKMVDQHCAMYEDRDHAYTGVIIVLKKTAVADIPITILTKLC